MVRRDQRAKARAVDITHVTHIQDNLLFARCQHLLHLFSQGVALVAENNTPVKPHHSDAIHFACIHFECHGFDSFGCLQALRPLKSLPDRYRAATSISKFNNNPNKTYNSRMLGNATCTYELPAVPNTRDRNSTDSHSSLPLASIRGENSEVRF